MPKQTTKQPDQAQPNLTTARRHTTARDATQQQDNSPSREIQQQLSFEAPLSPIHSTERIFVTSTFGNTEIWLSQQSTLDQVIAEIKANVMVPDGPVRLSFARPGQLMLDIGTENRFQQILGESKKSTWRWQLRVVSATIPASPSPATPQASPASAGPSVLSVAASVVQAQNQLKYNTIVEKNIRDKVAQLCGNAPSIGGDRNSLQGVVRLMRVLNALEDGWQSLCEDQTQEDGVTETQRLQWFLDACLAFFTPPLRTQWDSLPRPEQLSKHYETWDAFAATVLKLAINFQQIGRPLNIVRAMGALLPWAQIRDRKELLAEVDVIYKASLKYNDLRGLRERGVLEEEVLAFFTTILTPNARDALRTQIGRSPAWQENHPADWLPDLLEVGLPLVLDALRQRDNLEANWELEFQLPTAIPLPATSNGGQRTVDRPGRDASPQSFSMGPRTPPRRVAASPTREPAGSHGQAKMIRPLPQERTLIFQGTRYTFPFHLQTLTDHSDRQRAEQDFLKCTVNATLRCRKCSRFGHHISVCPLWAPCRQGEDPTAKKIDTNEQSFFYNLIPPPAILALRKPQAEAAVHHVATDATAVGYTQQLAEARKMLERLESLQSSLNESAGAAR